MKQLLLTALFFLTGFLISQTNTVDTLYFANKKFAIKKSNTESVMSAHDFPFAIFYCEYDFSGEPWTYFSVKECNCKKSGTMYDSQGYTLEEKICNDVEKTLFTEHNLLDTITIDLKHCCHNPHIKTSDKINQINSIQFKIVYENLTRTLSATSDYQFSSLYSYLLRNPGYKFIVVEQMFYQDKKEKIYRLPFTFLLKQK